ncbi:MAG: hypothetical protein E7580_01510 [Ruminococcaceae bacterium]|nr:hypothetical protein [Oscillospiraceae bacterium]
MKEAFAMQDFGDRAIDIHSHFNHGVPFEIPSGDLHRREISDLEKEYGRFGIEQVGISSFASVYVGEKVFPDGVRCSEQKACICAENLFTHHLVQASDRFRQWVVVDPRYKETFEQAEKMLMSPKTLGVKIHPSYHGYDILEHGDEIFSFAHSLGAVVLMHPQHTEEISPLADKYPNMKLIIAHLGSMAHINAILRSRAGNIYTDTSGRNISSNRILEYAVERVGSERILFGTDTYSLPFQFGRVVFADLTKEDRKNILYQNALRLFPRALK